MTNWVDLPPTFRIRSAVRSGEPASELALQLRTTLDMEPEPDEGLTVAQAAEEESVQEPDAVTVTNWLPLALETGLVLTDKWASTPAGSLLPPPQDISARNAAI